MKLTIKYKYKSETKYIEISNNKIIIRMNNNKLFIK